MLDLFKWNLELIRTQPCMSWLEDRREEWTPLLASRLKFLLDGRAFVIICDDETEWFGNYMVSKVNHTANSRPLLPFFTLKSLYKNYSNISTIEEMKLVDDMLNLSFANGIVYFYIGKGDCRRSQIAKNHEDSYMWLIDERAQNSFYLSGQDEMLDMKLIQLFWIFNKSIDAVLFNEVVL